MLATLGDEFLAALEDLGDVFVDRAVEAVGVEIGVGGAERRVHQPRPDQVFLLGDAHEAADHARDDRLGDVGDQIARLAPGEPVEHAHGDRADRVLVIGDALGRETALEQRLQAVVLGRVHADEHRARQLDRKAGRGDHHAAEF